MPLVIDNTRARRRTCAGRSSIGADIVVHSATKYLGGHGTTMGGVIVESGKFPWDNGKFPQMTEPSRGYHGVIFYETFGDFGFTMKARMETMRTLGADAVADVNAWLLLQGIETLHLRMPRALRNRARRRAASCRRIRAVGWVNYPGLPDSRSTRVGAERSTCRAARGGILTFGVKGGARGRRALHRGGAVPVATSPTSATRRRWSSIRRRRRTASSTRTSSAPPASRRT